MSPPKPDRLPRYAPRAGRSGGRPGRSHRCLRRSGVHHHRRPTGRQGGLSALPARGGSAEGGQRRAGAAGFAVVRQTVDGQLVIHARLAGAAHVAGGVSSASGATHEKIVFDVKPGLANPYESSVQVAYGGLNSTHLRLETQDGNVRFGRYMSTGSYSEEVATGLTGNDRKCFMIIADHVAKTIDFYMRDSLNNADPDNLTGWTHLGTGGDANQGATTNTITSIVGHSTSGGSSERGEKEIYRAMYWRDNVLIYDFYPSIWDVDVYTNNNFPDNEFAGNWLRISPTAGSSEPDFSTAGQVDFDGDDFIDLPIAPPDNAHLAAIHAHVDTVGSNQAIISSRQSGDVSIYSGELLVTSSGNSRGGTSDGTETLTVSVGGNASGVDAYHAYERQTSGSTTTIVTNRNGTESSGANANRDIDTVTPDNFKLGQRNTTTWSLTGSIKAVVILPEAPVTSGALESIRAALNAVKGTSF